MTGAGWFGQMRPRLIGGGQIGGLGCRKAWIWAERAAYQWDSKIWGWIPNGLGLHDTSRSGVDKIDGRMDAELYTSILQDDFLRTVEFYELDRADFIFQQDNEPKHICLSLGSWCRVEWNKIPVCRHLIERMPRRIEAVIKAKGGPTKY